MKKIVLFIGAVLLPGIAFAHAGGGHGGGGWVVEQQAKAPPICQQDGSKLVLIADPSKPCPNQ